MSSMYQPMLLIASAASFFVLSVEKAVFKHPVPSQAAS